MNINHTRDLVRMGNAFYDKRAVSEEQRKEDLQILALCTWAFVRSMKRHLSPEDEDEEDFKEELYEKLPAEQAQKIIDAAHRPNRALQDLSLAIENLPMHFLRKNEVHKAVTIFEDNLGSSERLLTSPVPLFYSRHTARFLVLLATSLAVCSLRALRWFMEPHCHDPGHRCHFGVFVWYRGAGHPVGRALHSPSYAGILRQDLQLVHGDCFLGSR